MKSTQGRQQRPFAVLHTSGTVRKKSGYLQATMAIQKKLAEIKKENGLPPAVNKNSPLFRYNT
ncbi:MAG: hypothetical protein ABIU63_03955 [Chitinophagaceae bacterium]